MGYDDIAAAAAARVKQRADEWNARMERERNNIRLAAQQTEHLLVAEGHRMRVLLEKAENMVAAFFAELDTVRQQIPDELLSWWCLWKLGRSLEGLDRLAKIFDFADEDRVRASLKKARILAKEQAAEERARVAAEKAAEREAEAEARRQRESEKAAEAAEAERRAALAQARVGSSKKVTPELVEEIKRRLIAGEPAGIPTVINEFGVSERVARNAIEQARGEIRAEARLTGVVPAPRKRAPRRRDSRDVLVEMAEPETQPALADSRDLDDLTKTFRAAYRRLREGRSVWIEATLEIASVLRQARECSPSNAAFSAWLEASGAAKISPRDRAALISMAEDLAVTRAALEKNPSWSWRLIWEEINHLGNAANMVNDAPSQALH